MKDATEYRAGVVVIRRPGPVFVRTHILRSPRDTLAQEFRRLRQQLPGATPDRRAEIIRLLNENLRAQKVAETHAPFFDPSRRPQPGEALH